MKILEALKKGLSVVFNLKELVILVFLVNLVFNVVITILTPQPAARGQATTAPPLSPVLGFVIFIIYFIFVLIGIFMQGGTFSIIKENIKSGVTSLAEFVNFGKKFYLRLLALGVILFVLILLITALAMLVIFLGIASKNNAIGLALGLIIGCIGILFMLLLMFSPYAMICEDLTVLTSLKKSLDMVRDNFLKILGLLLLVLLIAFLLGLAIGFITGILTVFIKSLFVKQIISAIFMSGLNAYVTIFVTASIMAYYLSLRHSGAPLQKPLTQAT